jgi:anti-anti-sigma factor
VLVEGRGEVLLIRLLGEHDLATAPLVRKSLEDAVRDSSVVVSLDDAEFVDSTVLGALFSAADAARRLGRPLVLHLGTAPIVRRIAELTGLTDVIPCFANLEAAIGAAREAP